MLLCSPTDENIYEPNTHTRLREIFQPVNMNSLLNINNTNKLTGFQAGGLFID
jgi:hypothetical protein